MVTAIPPGRPPKRFGMASVYAYDGAYRRVVGGFAEPGIRGHCRDLQCAELVPLRGSHLIGCTYLSKGPCGGSYHEYWAIDIKGSRGEDVYAAGAGKVVDVVNNQPGNCDYDKYRKLGGPTKCPNGSRGNRVVIDHGNGVFSYYQHLLTVSVPVPDKNKPRRGLTKTSRSAPLATAVTRSLASTTYTLSVGRRRRQVCEWTLAR
jgi:hypothetical protein